MAHPTPDTLALIALDEDVDAQVLEHVGRCDVCFAEIGSFQQVVAVGRSLGPEDRLVAPHPRVWSRIAYAITDGRVIPLPGAVTLHQRAPVVPPAEPGPVALGGLAARTGEAEQRTTPDRVPLRRRRWFLAAAAAAVALVVGVAGGFGLRGLLTRTPDVVSATQLNALPQFAGASGTAAVEKDPGGLRTLVVTMQMPADLHPVGTLEVWMSDTRATNMVEMGTMPGLSGRFPIPATIDLASHPIIDISLEPPDDTDPSHSDTSVLRGRLQL